MALENDTRAPDFALPNQFGELVQLGSFRGPRIHRFSELAQFRRRFISLCWLGLPRPGRSLPGRLGAVRRRGAGRSSIRLLRSRFKTEQRSAH